MPSEIIDESVIADTLHEEDHVFECENPMHDPPKEAVCRIIWTCNCGGFYCERCRDYVLDNSNGFFKCFKPLPSGGEERVCGAWPIHVKHILPL